MKKRRWYYVLGEDEGSDHEVRQIAARSRDQACAQSMQPPYPLLRVTGVSEVDWRNVPERPRGGALPRVRR